MRKVALSLRDAGVLELRQEWTQRELCDKRILAFFARRRDAGFERAVALEQRFVAALRFPGSLFVHALCKPACHGIEAIGERVFSLRFLGTIRGKALGIDCLLFDARFGCFPC